MRSSLLTRRMASLVLAWFVAFIAVMAIAPSVAQAQPMDAICTSGGFMPMPSGPQGGDDSSQLHADHALKCFMCCSGGSAPPPAVVVLPQSMVALADALQPLVAAHLASLARAPLPARGPPFSS